MSIQLFKNTTIYKCSECNINSWNDQEIILEIDHINGNNQDNDIKNLRYLCPNCHSQTPTWRGRNIPKKEPISDETLINAINETPSIRQALIKVGLAPKGGNYARCSKLINSNPIQTNNSQYGTIWITKDKHNKKIKKELLEDYIAQGYRKGRYLERKPPSKKNKIWITNGLTNKMVDPNEIPEGFWKGRFIPR